MCEGAGLFENFNTEQKLITLFVIDPKVRLDFTE